MKTGKPKTKIITGCNDCPFVGYDTINGIIAPVCLENDYKEIPQASLDLLITPKDCPLKTQAIIVTYET